MVFTWWLNQWRWRMWKCNKYMLNAKVEYLSQCPSIILLHTLRKRAFVYTNLLHSIICKHYCVKGINVNCHWSYCARMCTDFYNNTICTNKPRHVSVGVLFTSCSILGGWVNNSAIWINAKFGSLHVLLYSHFSSISNFVFTCDVIPEILLSSKSIKTQLHSLNKFSMGYAHTYNIFMWVNWSDYEWTNVRVCLICQKVHF